MEQDGNIYYVNPSGITGSDGRAVAPDGADPFTGQIFFNPEPGRLGGLNHNMFSGPQYFNWDFSVAKRFHLGATEDMNLEFRAEFFNFPNHHFFMVGASENINHTNFGQVGETVGDPRIIQFALRLVW